MGVIRRLEAAQSVEGRMCCICQGTIVIGDYVWEVRDGEWLCICEGCMERDLGMLLEVRLSTSQETGNN